MTEPQPPETLDRRTAYTGRLLKVDIETVRNPEGRVVELEMVRHPGAVAIVPLLSNLEADDPQLLLLRQFRHAANGVIWEIPAGVLEPGEERETGAHRELREETGAVAGRLQHLTTIYTTPGFTDERIHLYLATDLTVETPQLEDDESISVVPRPLSEALTMIRDGEIVDGKTIAGLLYVAGFTLNR